MPKSDSQPNPLARELDALESTQPDFDRRIATVVGDLGPGELGLALDHEDRPTPWGFFAVATHGPFDSYTGAPVDSAVTQAVWKAVEDWENLTKPYDLSTLEGKDQELQQIADAINGITTNPFFCIEPESTYRIDHVNTVSQMKDRVNQAIQKGVVRKQGATNEVTPHGEPWYINPMLAVANYQTRVAGSGGKTLCTNSMAVLKEISGAWKLNVITNMVYYASAVEG